MSAAFLNADLGEQIYLARRSDNARIDAWQGSRDATYALFSKSLRNRRMILDWWIHSSTISHEAGERQADGQTGPERLHAADASWDASRLKSWKWPD